MTPQEFDALPDRPRALPKMARSQMRSWAARHLATQQGGLCPACGKHIDLRIKGEGVIDHRHDTGEVRGVLHRSCNAALGKLDNAVGRWGSKSMDYATILPFLRNVVAYYEQRGAGIVYALHKTADELKDTRNLKVRQARAAAKAKVKLALAARKAAP